MPLSETLCSEIEKYCESLVLNNPMFTNARNGKLSPSAVRTYLQNILFLIQHTPLFLEKARRRSESLGLHKLVGYYSTKLGEEEGHDNWAKADISQVENSFQTSSDVPPLLPVNRLVNYLDHIIEEDPSLYLPYILLAEYMTVVVGPEWLKNLEEKCGIPVSMMSVVGNHTELDKHHVQEFIQEIDSLVDESAYRDRFEGVLKHCMKYYWDFAKQIGELAH